MSAAARVRAPCCVILLRYTADLSAIDAAMADHVAWLEQGFAAGLLVACGRQDPRTGGVIITRGDRAGVEALAATDPFVARGLATAEVVAFTASMATPDLAGYLS